MFVERKGVGRELKYLALRESLIQSHSSLMGVRTGPRCKQVRGQKGLIGFLEGGRSCPPLLVISRSVLQREEPLNFSRTEAQVSVSRCDQGCGLDNIPFMLDGHLENPDVQEHPQVLKSPPPKGYKGPLYTWRNASG